MSVARDLTLIYNAILMIVEEFDGVLDRQNMVVTIDIYLVNHRRESGRFTRTGGAGYEDKATRLFAHVRDDRGQTESFERFDLVGNCAKDRADRTLLVKEIGTKTRHSLQPKREI